MSGQGCAVDGCERPRHLRAYCRGHYMKLWRYGDPLGGVRSLGRLEEWLGSTLAGKPTDACVEWPFARSNGYGVISQGGAQRFVTHVVLERTGRVRPTVGNYHGACALHSCDNPPCVNPRHLRWGTSAENVGDRTVRGRAAVGVKNANAKLTDADVLAIFALRAAGMTHRAIAEMYEVAIITVSRVLRRASWTHVPVAEIEAAA